MDQSSAPYQTVIYDMESGSILRVESNLYISSRRHLANLMKQPHWKGLAFLYFPHPLQLDAQQHTVKRLSPNLPPSLVAPDGIPIDFQLIIQERKTFLTKPGSCLVEFEGGAGDQLMEAAAVLTAMSKYPNTSFSIKAAARYVDILRHVKGIPQVETAYVGHAKDVFNIVVSNHTPYISDPRGGLFGKASLYGAWLGLDKVTKVAKLNLSKSDYETEISFFNTLPLSNSKLNFICQFRSGSGHAKSWQHENVHALAALLHSIYDCNFFVVGNSNELPAGLPGIIDLTGNSTWWQTFLLISKCDAVFCIDSGVMHIARSLGVPYIALWGGTNAQVILGEQESALDIRLDLPCRDQICYDCGNKTNACMAKINPQMVVKNARLLLDQPE